MDIWIVINSLIILSAFILVRGKVPTFSPAERLLIRKQVYSDFAGQG